MLRSKLFHDLGAATIKARSPNLILVCGTSKSSFVANVEPSGKLEAHKLAAV